MVIDKEDAVQMIKAHFAMVQAYHGEDVEGIQEIGKDGRIPEEHLRGMKPLLMKYSKEYWREYRQNPKVVIHLEQ